MQIPKYEAIELGGDTAIQSPSNNQTTTTSTDTVRSSNDFFHSTFSKTLLLIIGLEVISVYGLLFFVPPSPTISQASSTQVTAEILIDTDTLIQLTNNTRQEFGLNALKTNHRLEQAAYAKAYDMFVNKYFDHTSGDGNTFSSWIRDTGYDYSRVGENLAINYSTNQTVLDAWMKSPSHRSNILNVLYEEIGIAVVQGNFNGNPTTIVVQIFGTPK